MCLVLSGVRLFVTPWAVTCQAPLSIGFSRQEYWSWSPFPSPGDLPHLGIKPESPLPSALQADSLPAEPSGKPKQIKAHLFEGERGHIALNHNSVIDTDDR
ncbi:unnamed protein product [Rangifer tarandus platyrhynchus]|uniref:Uncharacterized protein n=1 Tax=Rangifer tarandus platyrhynchus TaxID=3082113 RepID=A0AC59YQE8_RANTA